MSHPVEEAGTGTEGIDYAQITCTDLEDQLKEEIKAAVRDKEKAKGNGSSPVHVNMVSVHDFMKKVQYRVVKMYPKESLAKKKLIARKISYFKNKTRHRAKFCFKECVMDTTSCTISRTRGFTVGVVGGLAPSSPIGGGIVAGAGASYSRSKSTIASETHASSKELLGEITLKKDECARAVTELYHTVYEATCELDITANDPERDNMHRFLYTPHGKTNICKVTAGQVLNKSGGEKDFTFTRKCDCVMEDCEYELRIEMDTDAKKVQWRAPYSPILGWAFGVP